MAVGRLDVPGQLLDRLQFVAGRLRDLHRQEGGLRRGVPHTLGNTLRDLPYGMPLGGKVKTRYADLGAHDTENVSWDKMDALFASIDVQAEDVLVDVGCGKGRSINWFLQHFPRNSIVGIELDPTVGARTAKRLRRRTNVVVICGDATRLVPAQGTIFYAFNPFNETAMQRFADTFCDVHARGGPAGRTIAYLNAKCLSVFAEDPRFSVRELDDPRLDYYPHRSAVVTLR